MSGAAPTPPPAPPALRHWSGPRGRGDFSNGIPPEVWAAAFAETQSPATLPPPISLAPGAALSTSSLATTNVCASLPSSECAYALVQGDWSQLPTVVLTTLGRAALIGVGMALLGERRSLVRNSLGGALGIEAFVLGWAYMKTRKGNPS